MLSVIIFIFWPEETELIKACLKSAAFADEIVVIDNGAPRQTLDIVKRYTKTVFPNASKSFADRHNFAKDKAKGDWLLYLDCDERISIGLQKEILEAIKNPAASAFQLHRVNFFLGKQVEYGEIDPDLPTRLFKRIALSGWTGEIHESSRVEGKIGKLTQPLYHLTHRDICSMMRKTINFAEHEADLRLESHHPPVVWWRLIRVILTEAWTRLIRYQGWRQGTEGWIDGLFQSFALFVIYARLWEKQRSVSLDKTYQQIDKKILSGEI